MTRLYSFLMVLFSCSSLFSQQAFTYDTALAKDCSRDRKISIAGKSISVPKNAIFNVGRFIGYAPGMGFCPVFEYSNGSKDTLASYCDSFMSILDDERNKELSFYVSASGYYYNDKHPFLKVDSIYQFLISYSHFNYTVIYEGICAPGLGWNLIDFKSPGNSFEYMCLPFSGSCTCDSAMYGVFRDTSTGEELRFVYSPFSVEYRSKTKPHWKKLYIYQNNPGDLVIGFTPNASFLSLNNYELKFNGKYWIIPSRNSYIKERNRANPQFFRRL